MKKGIVICAGLMLLSGCAKVRHMDQLLTLKDLSDERDRLGRYIEEQDRKFESMLEEMRKGALDRYPDKREILRTFGEPIYVKNVTKDDQDLESWLYRHATEFFGAEKIYLYFDSGGNLVASEYIEGKNGKSR